MLRSVCGCLDKVGLHIMYFGWIIYLCVVQKKSSGVHNDYCVML